MQAPNSSVLGAGIGGVRGAIAARSHATQHGSSLRDLGMIQGISISVSVPEIQGLCVRVR